MVRIPLHDNAAPDEHSGTGTHERRAATTSLPEVQPMQVEVKPGGTLVAPENEDGPVNPLSTAGQFSLFNPRLEELASITEEDFQRVFSRSPIKRVKYRGWLRNLCVVMGNSGNRQFIPWLETAADHPDPLVQEHAAWALRRLRGGV